MSDKEPVDYIIPECGWRIQNFGLKRENECEETVMKKISEKKQCENSTKCIYRLNCKFYHDRENLEQFLLERNGKKQSQFMQLSNYIVPKACSFQEFYFEDKLYCKVSFKKRCDNGRGCEHKLRCIFYHSVEELIEFRKLAEHDDAFENKRISETEDTENDENDSEDEDENEDENEEHESDAASVPGHLSDPTRKNKLAEAC